MTLKKKAAEGVRHYAWSSVLANLLKAGQLVLLANLLTPTDVGLFGMAAVVIGIAALLADAGTANALIHHDAVTPRDVSSLHVFNLAAGFILMFVIWAGAPLFAWLYHEPRVESVLRLYALVLPLSMMGLVFGAMLEKHLEFEWLARIDVWAAFSGVVVAILTALGGAGVYAFVWGALANAAARTLAVSAIAWRRWPPTWLFSAEALRRYFRFGLPHIGQRAVNYMYGNIDLILVGAVFGAEALGFYALAMQIILMLSSKANLVFARVFFPLFAPVRSDALRLRHGYLRLQEITALVNLPLLVGLAVVAPLALPLLVGEAWQASVDLIRILSVVAITRAIAGTVGPLLLVKGRTFLGLQWGILLLVLQTVGMIIGVATDSLVLAAITNAMLSCLFLPLNYLLLVRPMVGPCLRAYIAAIWPAMVMSLIMAIALLTIGELTDHAHQGRTPWAWTLLIVEVTVGAILYTALLWLSNRAQLSEMIRLLRGRHAG